MCSQAYGSGMIGKNHDLEVLAALAKILVYGSKDLFVDKLYGKHLIVGLGSVSALIGTFNVYVNVVCTALKSLDSCTFTFWI